MKTNRKKFLARIPTCLLKYLRLAEKFKNKHQNWFPHKLASTFCVMRRNAAIDRQGICSDRPLQTCHNFYRLLCTLKVTTVTHLLIFYFLRSITKINCPMRANLLENTKFFRTFCNFFKHRFIIIPSSPVLPNV